MAETIHAVIEIKIVGTPEVVAAFHDEDAAIKFIETTQNDYDGNLVYNTVTLLRDFTPVEEADH